jgi:tRNA(Glu) U13 pseudouridine synthase TruD
MKIVIERSGRSFFLHALHWVVFGLYVYQMFTKEDYLTSLNCAIWVGIAYVRFLQLTASEVRLQMLESEVADEIINGFKQFMKDNKDELVDDLNNKKDVKIKLGKNDERAN